MTLAPARVQSYVWALFFGAQSHNLQEIKYLMRRTDSSTEHHTVSKNYRALLQR